MRRSLYFVVDKIDFPEPNLIIRTQDCIFKNWNVEKHLFLLVSLRSRSFSSIEIWQNMIQDRERELKIFPFSDRMRINPLPELSNPFEGLVDEIETFIMGMSQDMSSLRDSGS